MTALIPTGTRIRLISTSDAHTRLRPGDEGTVTGTDSLGSLQVAWDSGSSLALVAEEDAFEVI